MLSVFSSNSEPGRNKIFVPTEFQARKMVKWSPLHFTTLQNRWRWITRCILIAQTDFHRICEQSDFIPVAHCCSALGCRMAWIIGYDGSGVGRAGIPHSPAPPILFWRRASCFSMGVKIKKQKNILTTWDIKTKDYPAGRNEAHLWMFKWPQKYYCPLAKRFVSYHLLHHGNLSEVKILTVGINSEFKM